LTGLNAFSAIKPLASARAAALMMFAIYWLKIFIAQTAPVFLFTCSR
jgi:hypothetical protein